MAGTTAEEPFTAKTYACRGAIFNLLPANEDLTDNICTSDFRKRGAIMILSDHKIQNFGTQSCQGSPESSDFFKVPGLIQNEETAMSYPLRRRTLFNLYSMTLGFIYRAPKLVITRCDFQYFIDGWDTLVYVENDDMSFDTISNVLTLWSTTNQFFLQMEDSVVKHSLFCKGAIVFRPSTQIYQQTQFQNLTQIMGLNCAEDWVGCGGSCYTSVFQATKKYACAGISNQLELLNSTFLNLGWGTNLTAFTATGKTGVTRSVQGTDVAWPKFVNHGLLINIDQYPGDIYLYKNTIQSNTHFIRPIVFNKTKAVENMPLASFLQPTTSQYFAVSCTTQDQIRFLVASQANLDQNLVNYDLFEHFGTVIISRSMGTVAFQLNNFTNNFGTFGGAVLIDSPRNLQLSFIENTFKGNFAYFGGNAVYVKAHLISVISYHAIGYFVNNTWEGNFGMRAVRGGALGVHIDTIASSHKDYNFTLNTTGTTTIQSYKATHTTSNSSYLILYGENFTENFCGSQGSAVYLYQVSVVAIINC